jgi:hypothetical protein
MYNFHEFESGEAFNPRIKCSKRPLSTIQVQGDIWTCHFAFTSGLQAASDLQYILKGQIPPSPTLQDIGNAFLIDLSTPQRPR